MLSVSTLLNQLTTMQQLVVETDLQSKVAFNSSSLSVFSSMLFGETTEEILKSCCLDQNNYPRQERPIYQAILDFHHLKPENARDQFLSEVYFAIHEEKYESKTAKFKTLEKLFHQMKRFDLEQESAELLHQLEKLSVGTPLHTVYEHLYNKYHEIELNNNKAYFAFEKLNLKVSNYLGDNSKKNTPQDLIKVYKEIRSIHLANENRVSACLLNMAKLTLANYCNQTQLLKEGNLTLSVLYEICKVQIESLPFGVERLYIKNIFNSNLKKAILSKSIKITTLEFQHIEVEQVNSTTYNFGFNLLHEPRLEASRNNQLINNFVRSTATAALMIKQNSIFVSPQQI